MNKIRILFSISFIAMIVISCSTQVDPGNTTTSVEVKKGPLVLSLGGTVEQSGISITVNKIYWYEYKTWNYNYSPAIQYWAKTRNIVIDISVKNGTSQTLQTNPLYSWGALVDQYSSTQLNGTIMMDPENNAPYYDGYTILPGVLISDCLAFKPVPIAEIQESNGTITVGPAPSSVIFKLIGDVPYLDSNYQGIPIPVEFSFSLADVVTYIPQ